MPLDVGRRSQAQVEQPAVVQGQLPATVHQHLGVEQQRGVEVLERQRRGAQDIGGQLLLENFLRVVEAVVALGETQPLVVLGQAAVVAGQRVQLEHDPERAQEGDLLLRGDQELPLLPIIGQEDRLGLPLQAAQGLGGLGPVQRPEVAGDKLQAVAPLQGQPGLEQGQVRRLEVGVG